MFDSVVHRGDYAANYDHFGWVYFVANLVILICVRFRKRPTIFFFWWATVFFGLFITSRCLISAWLSYWRSCHGIGAVSPGEIYWIATRSGDEFVSRGQPTRMSVSRTDQSSNVNASRLPMNLIEFRKWPSHHHFPTEWNSKNSQRNNRNDAKIIFLEKFKWGNVIACIIRPSNKTAG